MKKHSCCLIGLERTSVVQAIFEELRAVLCHLIEEEDVNVFLLSYSCRDSLYFSLLQRLGERYPERGIRFIGVSSTDIQKERAREDPSPFDDFIGLTPPSKKVSSRIIKTQKYLMESAEFMIGYYNEDHSLYRNIRNSLRKNKNIRVFNLYRERHQIKMD
ncbi:MAG: hypothetical protein U0M15_00275 [Bacillota bacterium]|nr:hypothetical protein [Bacillota bacterium]